MSGLVDDVTNSVLSFVDASIVYSSIIALGSLTSVAIRYDSVVPLTRW